MKRSYKSAITMICMAAGLLLIFFGPGWSKALGLIGVVAALALQRLWLRCPHCGGQLRPWEDVCPKCGKKVEEA